MGIGKWKEKISNDRSTRVMQSTSFSLGDKLVAKKVEKRKIRIGDWCVFQCEPKPNHPNESKKNVL